MLLEIIKLASEFGVSFAVICAVIFLIFKIIKSDKPVDKSDTLIEEEYSKDSNTRVSNNLKYHPLFSNTQYKLVMEIPSLQLIKDKPVKQQMFRDILRIELQTIMDICYEIVDIDTGSWSAERWESEMKLKINKIFTIFVKKSLEEGVPEIVLSKYNKWHTPAINALHSYISMLGDASVYRDNIARTNTLLLLMQLVVVTTIADAEKSIKELNGDVGGQMYKNAIIEH